jgi:hypothetical protein
MASRRVIIKYVSAFPSASCISFLLQVIDTASTEIVVAVPSNDEPEVNEKVCLSVP